MRMTAILLLATAATPALAQDHQHHGQHPQVHAKEPIEDPHAGHAMQRPQQHSEEIDHCAMGHLPPEQCPPKEAAEEEAAPHAGHAMPDPQAADDPHAGHAMPGDDKAVPGAAPESAVPPRAFEGPRHAADLIYGEAAMAPAREQLHTGHDGLITGMVMLERLEARLPTEGGDTGYLWDAQGWYGGDLNRFVAKTEGEGAFEEGLEEAEVQALYSRAIGPFFDLQAGVRLDLEPETRPHAVLGVQGLAPYMFHVDAALFLSDRGDLTARLEGEYDQKITQSLILQPRLEVELAAQDVPEAEIGAGVSKVEAGLRLRYEFVPEFAPYVGLDYEAKTGRTADLARAEGEDVAGLKLLLGLRAWF
ncbi:copper resistance protein B [Sphingomicrobium astaxanthinifaciens]|uniref:copper resistance protein B n=1 Tax=Sphingomicrobium astaxanthinifaciens TaxID=1227949 RepID=UPI001FCBB717|nr:copper resistance protein B [Sphingomicrobium astaxanthinifaciens]MCJ7420298.1 copper resistance protein B [Sphingomicrobium astaxanthinifaciens]